MYIEIQSLEGIFLQNHFGYVRIAKYKNRIINREGQTCIAHIQKSFEQYLAKLWKKKYNKKDEEEEEKEKKKMTKTTMKTRTWRKQRKKRRSLM